MGALAQPKPTAELDRYGRDPQSPSERLRRRTNYGKGEGYAKLFSAMVADIPRLTRGASCTHLILAILAHQDATNHGGWTPSLTLEDWASLAHCDVKEIQRNRDYLTDAKMASCKVEMPKKGRKGSSPALYSFRLHPERWQGIEDYDVRVARLKQAEEPVEEESAADDAEQENAPGNWRMSKPATVKAGQASKIYKPDVGISGFRVHLENVDAGAFAVVQGGTLTVRITALNVSGEAKAKGEARARVRKDHGDMDVLDTRKRGGETKGEVNHPRAQELLLIFDPLLAKSASRLLSFDSSSLLKSCEAIGDCDHEYLVEFAARRGERRISNPAHVPAICAEALAAWRAGGKQLKSPLSPQGRQVAENLRRLYGHKA